MIQARTITTVVTPASNYDLTSLANVKSELSVIDGKQDALLKRYITSASAAAAQYCNRKFQVETVQDEMFPAADPHPWQLSGYFEVLQLSRWPLVAIVSLTENGNVLVQDTDFIVDSDIGALYRLDATTGLRIKWNPWPKVIQYEAGYATIPAEVEDAVIRMVSRRYATKGQDPNLSSLTVPGVIEKRWWIASGSQAGNMSPDITDLLDNYRVPLVA